MFYDAATMAASERTPRDEASRPADESVGQASEGAGALPPDRPNGQSELAAREGVRPDMAQPRPLRTPTSPQREHIIAEAEALRRYVEGGGPVDYFRMNRPGGRKRVGFVVERERFNRIRAKIREEQEDAGPWIWHPYRGLHRRRS